MATKILVVDDDVPLTAILHEMLLDEGFEVNTAADGHEGYLAYLKHLPDVILTDIQMPGQSGLELMEHVWMDNPEVRAIYMSGELTTCQSGSGQQRQKLRGKLLRKPFRWAELMRVLSECLTSSRKGVPQS